MSWQFWGVLVRYIVGHSLLEFVWLKKSWLDSDCEFGGSCIIFKSVKGLQTQQFENCCYFIYLLFCVEEQGNFVFFSAPSPASRTVWQTAEAQEMFVVRVTTRARSSEAALGSEEEAESSVYSWWLKQSQWAASGQSFRCQENLTCRAGVQP